MRSTATSESSAAGARAGWLVVLAAFCGVMVSFGSLMVFTFSVFVKPLSAEFGWSREQISAAFGIAAMTLAVCSPVLGRLLDRYGAKRVVLPCMVVFGAAFASLSWLTPKLAHLYAIFFVLGVVGNATTQMGYGRAVSSWFRERRGLALAMVMAGTGMGSVVLPRLAQSLIDAAGWRTAYAVLGGLVFVMGVPLTAMFVRERPAERRREHTTRSVSVRDGLRSRPFWLLVAILFLCSIAVNGAVTHLSPLLTDRGFGSGDAAMALSVLGGMSLFGRLATGYFLDRFFGPWVSVVLLAGVAGGMFLLSAAATPGVALAAAALIGLGLGGEADVTPYLLTRYFGLEGFSTLYGFTWTAYAIAGAVGPVLMGRVFDATGSYGPLLMVMAGQIVVAALLALMLPAYPVAVEPAASE